ncbi:hypothetical protein F4553_007161 [Allocatelliglobosispora scoriae]|uniref:Uncharacterized protein n=1 Tax=Allocatelliglobosispora scoriae TaxID=643052 RepID=A0A841BX59_9ACTN|nr:hypothetical protein [Allocatelliglobosispora scoriae]MBB5873727.1 hypothetical protein [Allocatelliglobosispora scoriae]
MGKNSGKGGREQRDQAQSYIDEMPAETASGRMVNDDGSPADDAAWQSRERSQQTALKSKAPPVSAANKGKKGNQPRG